MQNAMLAGRIRSLFHDRRNMTVSGLLLLILALGAFLRFYKLGGSGIGNLYYAAAVKSMLLSWKNFFFVAFEPGGSVSVDKPALGFWVQALSAHLFGVTGFALALPNALAGVLSIFVIYKLISRPFGAWTGLVAALALALMPVAVSAERNNVVDGMLVFVLLLAAWAFQRSASTGQLRWLFVGVVLLGLGFNIKMLQAFLPLPGFYAGYFFGAKHPWKRKILHLVAATAVLVPVSLSWALVVDLTPADARPYVDSSSHNSVMELIFYHNGLERLVGQPGNQAAGVLTPLPGADQEAGDAKEIVPLLVGDFGTPGTLRLFTAPLAGEASWLLPFVLGGSLLLAVLFWTQPAGEQRSALLLWAGWLLPETLYFTYSTGLMHAYYLIMLGAPLAALAAMTSWGFGKVIRERPGPGWGLLGSLVFATLIFQGVTVWNQTARATWAPVFGGLLCSAGLLLAAIGRPRARFAPAALTLVFLAMLVAPASWSVMTTFNPSPDGVLPYAGPARRSASDPVLRNAVDIDRPALLNYMLANTRPGTYLFATGQSAGAAAYILATGRPVLPVGGFLGQEEVLSLGRLSELVRSGQLRFVLDENMGSHARMMDWIRNHCSEVKIDGLLERNTPVPGRPSADPILYDCKE